MNKELYLAFDDADFQADFSFVDFPASYLDSMAQPAAQALASMKELEQGSIANPDEERMVGHYWLRAPEMAPDDEIAGMIRDTVARVKDLADQVHK